MSGGGRVAGARIWRPVTLLQSIVIDYEWLSVSQNLFFLPNSRVRYIKLKILAI
uniref:Uncharacterized protein n=1 Tax=Lepeophtheirus salmonis TaxID=72036 RepID=A0A0K2U2Y4_LEPSM